MKQFESRNVLDRIENTWNMFFSPEWRVRVLPQILLMTVGTLLGILSFFPLFFIVPGFMEWGTYDGAGQMLFLAKALTVLLVPITIFTLISGMTYTYTVTVAHEYTKEKSWQNYVRLAWKRLWGWMWYGIWISLCMILLFAIGIVAYMSSSFLFGFTVLICVLVFFWALVPFYVGFPGFVLENSWSLSRFLSIFPLVKYRWWNTLGNMLLGAIVVSSVLSLVQQLIFWMMGVDRAITQVGAIEAASPIDWSGLFSGIHYDSVAWFCFGIILFFIISAGQRVFVTFFQYTVWRDIVTEAPEAGVNTRD